MLGLHAEVISDALFIKFTDAWLQSRSICFDAMKKYVARERTQYGRSAEITYDVMSQRIMITQPKKI